MATMNTSANLRQHSNLGSMFEKAHNFAIFDGTFNSAGRDIYNISSTTDGFRGLHLLYSSISISAVHNYETDDEPATCHPGTREAILTRLTDWVIDTKRDSQLCWLYGSAGAGKSSVAQTIADRFRREGKLAAGFFFWRSDSSRNGIRRLVPTLAIQLAHSIPALRPAINSTVETNIMILDAPFETQFRELILQPFQNHERESDVPFLVVLDGLDECMDGRDQERVLLTIADVLKSKSIPLLFLVTSRLEPRIRNVFNKISTSYICQRHGLEDSNEDIRKYFLDKFAEIKTRRILLTNSDVEQPWPTPRQLDELVYKASGQFIFASTVIKFVDDDFSLPSERLRIMLGLTDSQEQEDSIDNTDRPFRELDKLYREILSVNPNTQQLLQILGTVIVFHEGSVPTMDTVEQLLALKPGEVSAALAGMHSLLKADHEEEPGNIKFAHKSLIDFLLDPKRSGQFFIDRPIHHNYMARRCLKLIVDGQCRTQSKAGQIQDHNLSDDWSSEMYDNSTVAYHCYWGYHCISAIASPELIRDLRALDLAAYANTCCLLAFELQSEQRSAWRFIALLGLFIGKLRRVQRWLERSSNPPTDLIQRFQKFSSVGFYVSTSIPQEAHLRWRRQITLFGKVLANNAVLSEKHLDFDLNSVNITDAIQVLGADENRKRTSHLKHILPMEISTERPLTQCLNELEDDAEEYTEFVDLADHHTVIAVRCVEILIDQERRPLWYDVKRYWTKHLAQAIPRHDFLNLLDSYIRKGRLEDDEPQEVYKVFLKWLEQLDSSPVSAESARSRAVITALCNVIYPGCTDNGIPNQSWMSFQIWSKIHSLTAMRRW
ncbi:hypothetical protein FB446DRAFT_124834 [Lentinula raphanica]|nr:hypothetical protein FB446DRAFT_124834 [Lentinula raphanica]